jgi:hypothetical protein
MAGLCAFEAKLAQFDAVAAPAGTAETPPQSQIYERPKRQRLAANGCFGSIAHLSRTSRHVGFLPIRDIAGAIQ